MSERTTSNEPNKESIEAVFDVLAVYDKDRAPAYAMIGVLKAANMKPIGRADWKKRIDSWAMHLQCGPAEEEKRLESKTGQRVLLRNQWDDAIEEKLSDLRAQHPRKLNNWLAKKLKEATRESFYTGYIP